MSQAQNGGSESKLPKKKKAINVTWDTDMDISVTVAPRIDPDIENLQSSEISGSCGSV
jgi:hypothetical protein